MSAKRKRRGPTWEEKVEERVEFKPYQCLACGGSAREMPADAPRLLDYVFHRISREDFGALLRQFTKDKKSCFVSPRSGAVICIDPKAALEYENSQRRGVW
jgi:hypothetical protein